MRGSLWSPWQFEGTHTTGRNSRNTRRFPRPCEMRPDPPPLTPEHSQAHPCNSNGDLTFLRQHERLPDFPMVPGEESQATRLNSRQTMRFPCQCVMRPCSPAALREQSEFISKLKRRLDSLHATQGRPGSPSQLEMKADVPTTS